MTCGHCGNDFQPAPHVRSGGSRQLYCDDKCKRAAARKRAYAANFKSLGLFVPGIMKPTKAHKREWGYA